MIHFNPDFDAVGKVPAHVLEAARIVEEWANANSNGRWQLMGICDRQFVFDLEAAKGQLCNIRTIANLFLETHE